MANGRLSRIEVDSNNNVVGGEEVLLDGFWCQQYPSHSMGQLQFGADGALYASAGDGASFGFADYGQGGGGSGSPTPKNPCGDPPVPVGGNQTPPTAEGGALRSQDLRTSGDSVSLDGTIIRIDKATGAAFPGNPLLGGSADDDRIVAYGLRNPFRITFRPGTNDLWIGDVGWGGWEEINRVVDPTAGVNNFGWPCYEGGGTQPGYNSANLDICEDLYADSGAVTFPYYTYQHSASVEGCGGGSSSITGLAFYGGGDYPAQYDDALFFSDYSRGCIWTMYPGTGGIPSPSNIELFASSAPSVGLEIGPGGDLFSVDHIGGRILRYRHTGGGNSPPAAVAAASPLSGVVPLVVDFDGSGSSDPDGGSLSYAWDLDGDGQFDDSTLVDPSFTYTSGGTVVVGLEVDDGNGGTDTDTVTISVSTGGGGDGHVSLPGSSGNYITAPDDARLDITGDLDVRADVALDDWQTNNAKLLSKLGGAYELMLNKTTGGLRLAWRRANNGLVVRNSTAGLPVAGGERLQVRGVLDVDDGANYTVNFYYRTDTSLALTDNSGWTQLGSTVLSPGTTDIKADNSLVALGANVNGTKGLWAGDYYQALILDGINGVVAADPDFRTISQLTSTPSDYSQWQDTPGNPWTIQGTGWTYNPPS